MGKRRRRPGYDRLIAKQTAASQAAMSANPKRVDPFQKPGNWRVGTEHGEVVAIEPDRRHDTVFTGPDPFMEALEYAAKRLRETTEPREHMSWCTRYDHEPGVCPPRW